ncbi:MAG: transporter [Candidatus Eisenbacteria bacterium]|nr:transporter [Candidatus Eisenbacteria bacterium]
MKSGSWTLTVCIVCALCAPAAAAPIVGTSGNVLPQGKFMIDVWATWQEYTRTYSYNLDGNGQEGWVELGDDMALTAASFVPRLLYGVTDWLTIRASLPIEDRFKDFPEADGHAASTGLGDVIVDPKILLYRGRSGYPVASLLTGVRFPTGATDSDFPLSDGSTDFCGGFAVTHAAGSFAAHLCSVYWVNGKAKGGADLKDVSVTTVTVEDALNEHWSLAWEGRATLGEDLGKYYRVYACPGVAWTDGGKLTVGLSALVPVAAKGCPAIGLYDFDWAPYLRVYYRF